MREAVVYSGKRVESAYICIPNVFCELFFSDFNKYDPS